MPLADDALTPERRHERELAEKAGNSPHRYDDDWIDLAALGLDSEDQLIARIIEVLECVELDEEIYQFGLQAFVDQSTDAGLAGRIMQARAQLRDRLKDPAVARLVEPFDHERYNLNMAVSENLLFGTVYGEGVNAELIIEQPGIQRILDETGLSQIFLEAGAQITEIMLDLFSDVEPGSELFEQFSFISANDLPEFNQLLNDIRQQGLENLPQANQRRLMSLPLKLIVARHRLGLITEPIQQKILEARRRIHELAQSEALGIEFFDENSYNPRISVQDNILFGKLAYGQAHAQAKVSALIADVVESLGLRDEIIRAGLAYEVGVGGGRLSSIQRQKLGLARALLKAPDLLVINEALSGFDSASERRLIDNVRRQMESRGILWVLGRIQLAEAFDSVLVMERGKLVDQGSFGDMQRDSEHFKQLLAAE